MLVAEALLMAEKKVIDMGIKNKSGDLVGYNEACEIAFGMKYSEIESDLIKNKITSEEFLNYLEKEIKNYFRFQSLNKIENILIGAMQRQ